MDRPKTKTMAAIKGTKDILPDEIGKWQRVESLAKRLFELYGYREIRTPVFEATELFEKGTGETSDIVIKEMYTFTDKGGRSLTLRPEYTPSVVRAIIENRLNLKPQPMRFYYIGPMFRYDKPQKGRYRQFHQVDIEVFGEEDPAIDAEIVEMADLLLKRLNVTDTETQVNSVGCKQCRPAYKQDLKAEAEKERGRLCADCQRKIETNPLRIFDCKVETCQAIAQGFPKITDYLCKECDTHFQVFCVYLDLYGINYRIEPQLVRGIDYYTKTTFEIVTAKLGAQDAILGGGRYDEMMKDFGGPDICGTGFAMGLERLLEVVPGVEEMRKFLYLAYLGVEAKRTGMRLARYFRSEGIETLMEFRDRNLKNQMGRANKLGASWVLIVGEDEVRRGSYQLKTMATGYQVEGTEKDILDRIRKKPG
ncbi:MAG: histidine--tRNA ligase [Candidatus Aminicenantes bacterium]